MKRPTPDIRIIESSDGKRRVKASRGFLEGIIREELVRALQEAGEDDLEDASSAPQPKKKKLDPATASGMKGGKDPIIPDDVADDPEEDGRDEVPDEEDPADDEISGEDEGGGDERLSNELIGKTIQSVTMEPKSKLVPGATELVLTFNEITDPLKVIVTKTGEIRFFFRGGLHNLI